MMHGEAVVLRLLRQNATLRGMGELGMDDARAATVSSACWSCRTASSWSPGPTGSGKTSTLYTALHEINDADRKIITIEDPVEYQLKGVNQIQVSEKAGLTFARGLRSILRHDPDVVLIGEIRDQETAQIAVQASLTGHLVFSTLHTNDAPGRADAAGRHGRRAVPGRVVAGSGARPAAGARALPALQAGG